MRNRLFRYRAFPFTALSGAAALALGLSWGCSRSGSEAPAPKPAAAVKLGEGAYRVTWSREGLPATFQAGASIEVPVTFTNAGTQSWPDREHGDAGKTGAYAVRMSACWWPVPSPSDQPADCFKTRTDLSGPVSPGQTMTLLVPIEVPARSGAWELEFQLVHELVTWFSTEGAERLRYPVTVKP